MKRNATNSTEARKCVRRSTLAERLAPRFRQLDYEMEKRTNYYAMSPSQRGEARLERLNIAWKRALSGSEYYMKLANDNKLPSRFKSLEEFQSRVPITPKQAVRQTPGLFKFPGRQPGKWMSTSGSTGAPIQVFWGKEGHLECMRDLYWARLDWGVYPFDRQTMLWGVPIKCDRGLKAAYNKTMQKVVDRLRQRMRFSALHLNPTTLRQVYDSIIRFESRSLYAFPGAAHQLAIANLDRPLFPDTLKAAFLSAEPVLPQHRESIKKVFGCRAVGEYGSVECGMLAEQRQDGTYKVCESSVILETVDHPDGYSVLVTQLRNTAFPLFRYDIGDLTSSPLNRHKDEIESLGEIFGRSHDVVRSPNGGAYHGVLLEYIIRRVPSVLLFQVVQREDFSIDIQLQPLPNMKITQEQKATVRERIKDEIDFDMEIRIQIVDEIQRTPAGKHRYVTSELEKQLGCSV